ncbi:hypothetical protein [Streptomyces sp. SM11]|uniref:hypothetical protein n=1 Tax=Streptomyces sp. SM11 TaxID=565557 RepID=UPI0015E16C73|nr:hypothetical protein [Streptomyces sp. SM11]
MTTTTARQPRHIVHLRFELPDPARLEDLRPLLEQVTPQVQLLEPDSTVLDVTGALRFWNRTAEIARLVQLRAAAHHSVRAAAAAGPNRIQWVRRFPHGPGREPTAPRALPALDNSGFASAGPPELVVAGRGWRA